MDKDDDNKDHLLVLFGMAVMLFGFHEVGMMAQRGNIADINSLLKQESTHSIGTFFTALKKVDYRKFDYLQVAQHVNKLIEQSENKLDALDTILNFKDDDFTRDFISANNTQTARILEARFLKPLMEIADKGEFYIRLGVLTKRGYISSDMLQHYTAEWHDLHETPQSHQDRENIRTKPELQR